MRNLTCTSCGAPAEPKPDAEPFTMSGVGFGAPGTECLVTFVDAICAAGHQGMLEVESIEFPPEDIAGMEAGLLE